MKFSKQLWYRCIEEGFYSCAHIFKFLHARSRFFLRGKFIPKIAIFGDFGGCKATFFKAIKAKVSVIIGTWESLPMPNFVKIAKGDIPF